MSESTANKGPVDGIFLMKEGISLSCSDLERAFLEWKLEPTRAVGFFTERFENDLSQQHLSPLRAYNLVSDKALLVHRYYLNTRTVSTFLSHDGCQHLALSAYVSAISSTNPKIIVPSNNKSSNSSYKIDANSFANDCLPVVLRAAGLSSDASATTKLIGQSSIIARWTTWLIKYSFAIDFSNDNRYWIPVSTHCIIFRNVNTTLSNNRCGSFSKKQANWNCKCLRNLPLPKNQMSTMIYKYYLVPWIFVDIVHAYVY